MPQPLAATDRPQEERLFVAVELAEKLREQLYGLQSREIQRLKWSANLHLTLRFIGQVSPERAELIRQCLRQTQSGPFVLTIAGLGLFKRRTGGLLWAGAHKTPALENLKQQVDQALLAAGLNFAPEDYFPHITLSRMKKPVPLLLKKTVSEKASARFGEMTVTEFILFRSLLRPSGAIHEPVEKYRL